MKQICGLIYSCSVWHMLVGSCEKTAFWGHCHLGRVGRMNVLKSLSEQKGPWMNTSSLRQSCSLPGQIPCCKSVQKSWHLLGAQQVLECTEGVKSRGGCVCAACLRARRSSFWAMLPLPMQCCGCSIWRGAVCSGHQCLRPHLPWCMGKAYICCFLLSW